MSREIELRNGGKVKLFEDRTNGNSSITLQAPAALAGDIAIKLPSALPAGTQILKLDTAGQMATLADGTSGQFLKTDGSGNFSWDSAAVSLQNAYNGGKTIDSSAGQVDISASSTNPAVVIEQVNTAGTALNVIGYAAFEGDTDWTGNVDITGNATLTGNATITGNIDQTGKVVLSQTSTDTAISITTTATSSASPAVEIIKSATQGAGPALYVHSTTTNTQIAKFEKTDGGNGSCVIITDNAVSTGADSSAALLINNSGTSDGHRSIIVNHSHSGHVIVLTRGSQASSDGSSALYITDSSTGTHNAITVIMNTTTSASQILSSTHFNAYYDGRLYCRSISHSGAYYMRTDSGIVDSDGTELYGGSHNWSSSKGSTGVYTISFNVAFDETPAVTITVHDTTTSSCVAHVASVATNQVVVHVVTLANVAADRAFSFQARGRFA